MIVGPKHQEAQPNDAVWVRWNNRTYDATIVEAGSHDYEVIVRLHSGDLLTVHQYNVSPIEPRDTE